MTCGFDAVFRLSRGRRLRAGVNIRVVQEYLGHKNLQATEVYPNVAKNLRRTDF